MTQNNENTRLLSANPPPVNNATRPSPSAPESAVLTTFRSVFQLVHGVGENVRGTVLGAIDDWEERGEQKHHNVARQGRAEIDQAFQQLWGTSGSGTATAQAPPRPTASATGYDTAPPTYRATNSGDGAGLRNPDSKTSTGT